MKDFGYYQCIFAKPDSMGSVLFYDPNSNSESFLVSEELLTDQEWDKFYEGKTMRAGVEFYEDSWEFNSDECEDMHARAIHNIMFFDSLEEAKKFTAMEELAEQEQEEIAQASSHWEETILLAELKRLSSKLCQLKANQSHCEDDMKDFGYYEHLIGFDTFGMVAIYERGTWLSPILVSRDLLNESEWAKFGTLNVMRASVELHSEAGEFEAEASAINNPMFFDSIEEAKAFTAMEELAEKEQEEIAQACPVAIQTQNKTNRL